MKYNLLVELDRYYNQLVSLILQKSDYPFDQFIIIKRFYILNIKFLRHKAKGLTEFTSYELTKLKVYERIELCKS